MPISGLVITLAPAADAAVPELDRLEADPRLELGARAGARIAAVAETDTPRAGRALLEELQSRPGILAADVVFVEVDPEGSADARARSGSRTSHPGGDPS